jgi:hypothetical protein
VHPTGPECQPCGNWRFRALGTVRYRSGPGVRSRVSALRELAFPGNFRHSGPFFGSLGEIFEMTPGGGLFLVLAGVRYTKETINSLFSYYQK